MTNFKAFNIFSILTFFAFSYLPLRAHAQADYFSAPTLCSSEELAQELKKKTLDMCWHFGQDSHFRFVSENERVYFEISLGKLPSNYDDFLSRIKDKFIEDTSEGSLRFVFSYAIDDDGLEEVNIPRRRQKNIHPDESSYLVADRRVIKQASPEHIDREELSAIIRNERVLFYTGAGLSLASDVPAMNELHDLLGLETGERFLLSLENAIKNPREFVSNILVFHKACLFSAPTQAHLALKDIALFKNIRLITENLDCLHEASGIFPYRIDARQLRDEVGSEGLTQFDYIICIGLSYDDRGFLGWYKQYNPQGKIIAVDLQQPSYLGDEDLLAVGDLQELIPSIQKEIAQLQL
jgi:NAD-dependent SIR2 family protein deacetylase